MRIRTKSFTAPPPWMRSLNLTRYRQHPAPRRRSRQLPSANISSPPHSLATPVPRPSAGYKPVTVRLLSPVPLSMTSQPPFRLQILSDLHLEFGLPPNSHQYESYQIPAHAPYLLLAGDIGLLIQASLFVPFLKRVARDFEHVFLVLGNHEFYRFSRSEGLVAAVELEKALDGKVTVLHRRRVDIGDVTILGCTLHSSLDPAATARIAMGLNDFHLVKEWGPKEYMQEHAADLGWLREELAKVEEGRRVVIATHHAPLILGTSNPMFDASLFRSAFSTNILGSGWHEWKGGEKVKVWAFGHTHWSCDFVEETSGVRIVANQGGYSRNGREATGEGGTGFRKDFVVEV